MDWIAEAKRLFDVPKPEHFTDYTHCEECAEHDETLRNADLETIGLEQLGYPGWDPLCFCHVEGKKYYMPALIRLCFESLDGDFYLDQLLFHLEYERENNSLLKSCNDQQKQFIAAFLRHIIEQYPEQLDKYLAVDETFSAYELWQQA